MGEMHNQDKSLRDHCLEVGHSNHLLLGEVYLGEEVMRPSLPAVYSVETEMLQSLQEVLSLVAAEMPPNLLEALSLAESVPDLLQLLHLLCSASQRSHLV